MKKVGLFLLAVVMVTGFAACSGGGGDDDEPDQVNIQGSWTINMATSRGSGSGTLNLIQSGNVLTGNIDGAPLTGSLYEYTINFTVTVSGSGTIDFTGTVNPEGSFMAGTALSSVGIKGTWNATKQQPRHAATAPIVHMVNALFFSDSFE